MSKPILKPLIAIVTMLILMTVASILGIHFLIAKRIGSRVDLYRIEQQTHLKAYLEDEAVVAKDPVFARVRSETADAGPYLNPKLRWTPGPESTHRKEKGFVEFSEDWREDILANGGRWMRLFFRYNSQPIDFTLFAGIRKFDHWRLDENSPIADALSHDDYPNSVSLPLPDLTDLGLLSRLYLMRAVDTGETLSSLQDVRHLAILLLTTEHVETEMAGIALLKAERHAYKYYVENDLLKASEWSPVSEESVLRAQRVYLSARSYLHVWTAQDMLQNIFIQHSAAALCATVNDAVSDDWSLSGMLRPRIWPEEDLHESYAQLSSLVTHALSRGCRLTFVKAKIRENRLPLDADVPSFIMRTPFVRRLYGLDYASLPPSGFNLAPSTDSN